MAVSRNQAPANAFSFSVLVLLLLSSNVLTGEVVRTYGNDVAGDVTVSEELIPGLNEPLWGQDVVVDTKYGSVGGKTRQGIPEAGGSVDTVDWFLGVPYASPPIGEKRFRPPEAPIPWQGIRNSTKFGWVCPQLPTMSYVSKEKQNEDCLYLNIYSPNSGPDRTTYPVFVFIHGGSYRSGAGTVTLGHVLAQYGVVVVTINYRLGLFGFISTRDSNLPGNYGFLDQIQALKWIQENIRNFRGDPGSVTIGGNSAGAGSVGLLTLSPLARGLFHQAVPESGSVLSFWAIHNETVDLRAQASDLASLVNCRQDDVKAMTRCLRDVPWTEFPNHDEFPRYSPTGTDLKPHLDENILPRMPREMLREGEAHVTKVMTGFVENEWGALMSWLFRELLVARPDVDKIYADGLDRKSFESILDHVISERFGWDQSVTEAIKHEYTDWERPDDPMRNRDQYIDCMGDLAMVAPTIESARLYIQHHIPVYLYVFDHVSSQHPAEDYKGSYHTLELSYVFGTAFMELQSGSGVRQNFTQTDKKLSKRVMEWWSNFIKDGSPTQPRADPRWTGFQLSTSDYLFISSNKTEMRQHFRAKRVAFWNEYIPKLIAESSKQRETTESANTQSYGIGFTVVAVIAGVLLLLLIFTLVFCLIRMRRNDRRMY